MFNCWFTAAVLRSFHSLHPPSSAQTFLATPLALCPNTREACEGKDQKPWKRNPKNDSPFAPMVSEKERNRKRSTQTQRKTPFAKKSFGCKVTRTDENASTLIGRKDFLWYFVQVESISSILLALVSRLKAFVCPSNFPLIPSSFGTNTLGYQRSTLQQVSKSVLLQYPGATIRVPNWRFDK